MNIASISFTKLVSLAQHVVRPSHWKHGRRRRRWVFLTLAAPGFICVFATPLHRSFALLLLGALTFAGACVFRACTEPLFVREETTAPHPPAAAQEPHHV